VIPELLDDGGRHYSIWTGLSEAQHRFIKSDHRIAQSGEAEGNTQPGADPAAAPIVEAEPAAAVPVRDRRYT
jgi:hypothetical protein